MGKGGSQLSGFPTTSPLTSEAREQVAPDWAGLDNSCTKTLGFGKEAVRGDWQAARGLPVPFLRGPHLMNGLPQMGSAAGTLLL